MASVYTPPVAGCIGADCWATFGCCCTSNNTPIAANASTTIRICQRSLFNLTFDDLAFDDHRCHCQDEKKHAQTDCHAEKDLFDPAPCRENPPGIPAHQTA